MTKAPMAYMLLLLIACGSLYELCLVACPSSWYGVTLDGTVDMGGTYQTHGSPFDPNFPTWR